MQTTETKGHSIIRRVHTSLRFIPHILLLSSILIYIILGILGRLDLMIKASPILIPLIIISILLIIWKKPFKLCDEAGWELNISQKTLLKVFLIALSLLIIWLALGNGGLLQLILMFAMYFLIIIQMFARTIISKVIIFELIVTTSLFILPQLLMPAYYYGDIDLLVHSRFISAIVASSSQLPIDIAGTYTAFFLYHMLIAVSSLVSGLAVNVSLCLVSTIPVICTIPVVYLLARIFTQSERSAVFATFIYALTPMFIYNLQIPAPRVMATAAFIILLYLLFRRWNEYRFAPLFLTVLITMYMTMVHHAQLPLFFVVIALLCIGSFLYFKKIIVGNYSILLVIISIPILYLIYNYLTNFLSIIDVRLLNQIDSGAISVMISETGVIDIHSILSNLSSSVLVILILVGLYTLLTRVSFRNQLIILTPLILLMFVLYIPGVAEIFGQLSQSLQLYRFRLVLTPIYAIIMGFSLIVLLNYFANNIRSKKISVIVIIGLCLLLVSSMFIGYARDNEIFYNSDIFTPREYYYEESDMAMFKIVESFIASGSSITSDLPDMEYFSHSSTSHYYNETYYSNTKYMSSVLKRLNFTALDMMYLLYPDSRFNRSDLWVYDDISEAVQKHSRVKPSKELINIFKSNMKNYCVIYDNSDSQIYYSY